MGVGDYDHNEPALPDLKSPETEVESHRSLLENHTAIAVETLTTANKAGEHSPTKENLQRLLARWPAQRTNVVVFDFTGHGLVVEGKLYLLPKDADPSRLQATALEMSEVVMALRRHAPYVVLLLDACRSPKGRIKGASANWSRKDVTVFPAREQTTGTATVILYATRDGEVAYDGDGEERLGVFAAAKLAVLEKALGKSGQGFTINDFEKSMNKAVASIAAARGLSQSPDHESKGDLSFELWPKSLNVSNNASNIPESC